MEALRKQNKSYTNLVSKNFVFTPKGSSRYDVDVDNISLNGIQLVTILRIVKCNLEEQYSRSVIMRLNFGTPMLTSKVTFKERNDREDTQVKTLDVTAVANSDVVLFIYFKYNSHWKKVADADAFVVTPSNFTSSSDCQHDILFCDKLHQRLDDMVWSDVMNLLPIVTKQVLFRLRL